MKIVDLRAKSVAELKDLLLQSKKESFNLRFQKVNGNLSALDQLHKLRKRVARIKTIMVEKQKN